MSRGELLTSLDDLAAETLLAEPIDPLLSVQLRLLGGRPRPPSGSPHGPLTESHALYLFGVPSTPDTAEAVRTRQQDLTGALRPFLSGRKPYTFLTPGETAANAFTPDALNRLRNLKRERDPQGVFRSNFPVLG